MQDPLGNVTSEQYDAAGRLITETAPISGTTVYQYDNAGNTTIITQEDSSTGAPLQVDSRQYDALNRVITDTLSGPSSAPVTTTTRYDKDGNVYQVDQPSGAATVNTYDLADQLVSTESDGQPVLTATHTDQAVTSYDLAGNAISSIDQAGNTTSTSYDGDNRVLQSVAVTGTQTITTTEQYDPDGNTLTQTTQTYTGSGSIATHVVTATVNAADWPISTGEDGVPTNYGYDAAGQLRTQTVLTGTVPVTLTLDAEGRETALAAGVGGTPVYTDTTAYNANDLPVTLTLNSGPSQVQEIAGYDPNSRLTSWHDPGPGQNVTYAYGYDAANRVDSFTAVSGTDTITHDQATGWLTSDCGPQSVVQTTHCYAWSYDSNGNITQAIDDTGVTQYFTYSQSQPNELTQSSAAGYPNVAYSYDGAGNTTLISSTSTGPNQVQIHTQFTYDPQGRISTVTDVNGTVAQIGYNAAGERGSYTVTTSGGQQLYSAQFSYQNGQLSQASVVSATAGGGSVSYLDTYLYAQDGTPLQFIREQGGAFTEYWYETDGRGDVVAVTDNTGAVVDSYEYDLWGEPLPDTTHELVPQPLRYQGYWYDSTLAWYWINGRNYDPELERYYQPAPIGDHNYTYAGDDPIDVRPLAGEDYGPMPRAGGSGLSGFMQRIWSAALGDFRLWIGPLERPTTDPHFNLHITNKQKEDFNNWHIRLSSISEEGNVREYTYEATNYAESEQAFNPGNLVRAVQDEIENQVVAVRVYVASTLEPAQRVIDAAEQAYYQLARGIAADSQIAKSQGEAFIQAVTRPTTIQTAEGEVEAAGGALEYVLQQLGQIAENVPPP